VNCSPKRTTSIPSSTRIRILGADEEYQHGRQERQHAQLMSGIHGGVDALAPV